MYPFGLKHKGYNNQITGRDHQYEFAEEEFEEDLEKNTVAYQWRDYDPAIARFNKIDRFAEKYQNLSPYSYTANNPLRYKEIKGDSLSGLTRKDARRARRMIKNNFKGKNRKLSRLFKTQGKGFKKISEEDIANASKGASEEAIILAKAYATTINSSDMHRVEVVKRKDKLSKFSQTKTAIGFMGQKTGADVDRISGGGITGLDINDGTLSIIVMDTQNPLELLDTKTNKMVERKLNIAATITHEVLGHAVGITSDSSNALHLDAIQMENLSYRVQGLGRYQRNSHADNSKESKLTFTQNEYSGIPTFFQ